MYTKHHTRGIVLGKHDNGEAEGKTLIEAAREELMKATGLTSIDVEIGEPYGFKLK